MEQWKKNLWVSTLAVFIVSVGMSQMAPILPLYIQHLGISDLEEVERWSGIIFGANFISLTIFSPIWGSMADKYGRKPMVLRASLALACVMVGIGLAQNVYQLVLLRLLQGTMSGFQGAIIPLVASQTPQERSGWALGIIFTGQVSGSLFGPLFGGWLAELIGFRQSFWASGFCCFLGFLALLFLLKEEFTPVEKKARLSFVQAWKALPKPGFILFLFSTIWMIQFTLASMIPIVTVYVTQLATPGMDHMAVIAGAVYAASGFASMLVASPIGHLSDRVGPRKVLLWSLILGGLIFLPQAVASSPWELGFYRFVLGIATAGLLPSVNTLIKLYTPNEVLSRIYGLNFSCQFMGMFFGAIVGGHIASWLGIPMLFVICAVLLLATAVLGYGMMKGQKEHEGAI